MEKQRYRLVSDDDGHEYVIPVEKIDKFYEWLDLVEDPDAYDEYRIDGALTFTDPKVE